ncbi:uncharacterized protein DC041_0002080, partial [Schistosoma bovis]
YYVTLIHFILYLLTIYLGPEGWMASIETGSSCFTECLGSILDQMCRKSSYSNSVKLINLNYSNENVAQSFTHQVVSVLKGTIIPYSLRRFLWPLALFTVTERTRSEFENPIIWNGHKMRELESSARKNFGVLLASGTAKLGLTTPMCSKFDDIIKKSVKEISLELETKFKNQQKQFKQFKEQSVKILNVFYTAKQIYDPLYIYWLLPIHFALNKDYIYELIKHFPDIPTKVSINSADEGNIIYIIEYFMYFIIQMMNVNDFNTDQRLNTLIENENSYLYRLLKQWFDKLFVGTVNSIALLFFWDQLFLNSFNCDVIIEFAETILVLLGSDILQVNNFTDMEQLLNHGPNKLLTKDIIQTWNMIHLDKVLDDDYYKLNRLSGKLVSLTREIQETSKKDVNFYLQDFVIHNIIVTTVTDSRKILPPDLFRIKLDYIVEEEIKQSTLTETIPTIIFHGKISRIYDFLDQIYSTDEDYGKNKPNSITNYSYPSFIQEQSKMYITMFQFNVERSYSFMIYPYKLWTREVINPIEQGTYPEILYDSAWTMDYLLIPFNYLFYHFYSLPIIETDNSIPLQLLHGSRISLRLYNPNIEAVPKVIEQPTIYITRSVQTKVIYKETVNIEDAEYLQEEQIIDQEVEDIEELSPPATPIDDPWVPFKKLAPYERLMKPSSTSEPFCIYVDQLRFMPDNSTIFKVFSSYTIKVDKYSRTIFVLLTIKGLLNIGGHQLRLRSEVPKPISQNMNNNEIFYQEDSLNNAPYIHCSTILVRLLPYTEKPLPQPEYRFRSYRSAESTPTNFEWVVYRQFQSDENRKTDIHSMVKMILRREGEFDKSSEQNDFLTPDYLYRYTLQRMSIKRNTTTNGIPNQMISAFPFFYRVNDGFLLSLKDAKGLTVKEGDYIFGLAKVIRSSDTSLMPVNKFYGFGNDDDLLFDRFDSTMSLENPKWEDAPQLTKPYYDSNALLIIQIFRVPLVFTIGGSISITKSGNWFIPQLVSRKPNKRQITKLRRIHLIGWSFLRLFEW